MENQELLVLDNFITEEEEQEIIYHIPPRDRTSPKETRNSVSRYGEDVGYDGDLISREIPEFLDVVSNRMIERGLIEKKPKHVTINEYLRGQMIPWHIDSKKSGDVIFILSLLSPAIMNIRRKANKAEVESLSLQPRSLLQMAGQKRWEWEHNISPILGDRRYSIVFRLA